MLDSGLDVLRAMGAGLVVCAALTGAALAESKANQISVSVNSTEDRLGVNATYMYAVSGDLSTPGVLVRAGVGYGGGDDDGGSASLDALVGYQVVVGNWKMRAFAGAVVVQDDDIDNPYGFKVLGQVQNKKTDDIYVNANLGYNSAKEQLNGSVQVGFQVAGLVVGPEVGAVVTPDFVRQRIGVFVTGMKLGEVSLTARAGYSHYESDTESRDSAYAGASASLQY